MSGLKLVNLNVIKMNVISLFSGLGGLDLGFKWEGFDVIWSNDILPQARESYYLNFGVKPKKGDIKNIDPKNLPNTDLVIGGPPCQAFSLVGQRRPEDERGKLVFEFYNIVKTVKPTAFVMENVPGMAASKINNIPLPEILARAFGKLHYKVTLTTLLATDYLVPQLRKRIFILGCKKWKPEKPDGEIFAKERYGIIRSDFDVSARAAIGDLGPCTKRGERANYLNVKPSCFASLMRKEGLSTVSLHECPRMSKTDLTLVAHIPPGGNYKDVPDELSTSRIIKFKKTGGRTTTYGRLHPDRPSYTINTYFRRPNVGCNFHYSEPRLITAREAMRFQSIPDYFELVSTGVDLRNSLIGNAVPPLMAQAVAWSIKKSLNKQFISP